MKKLSNSLSTLLVLLFATSLAAQERTKPTLEELIPGGAAYRYTENKRYQWWNDDAYLTLTGDSLLAVQAKSGQTRLLVSASQLAKRMNLGSARALWPDRPWLLFSQAEDYVVYDWQADSIVHLRPVAADAANRDYEATSGNVAYTLQNNLYVNGKQVTDEPDGVLCGHSVHRNEFGIHKGTFWSPQGDRLAFYRMDERMVSLYPLVDVTARVGQVDYIRYPMAGMTSHKVSIGIYSPADGTTLYLNTGDATDRYFTNLTWSPDGKSLYLIELNRDQNHAKLCRYNVLTGEPEGAPLIEETHPKYVEPQHPICFLPGNPRAFIYQSQRDGFNHLYLYNTDGQLIKQLTQGSWMVQELLGFNFSGSELFIASTEASPLQSNLYKVDIKSGKRTPLGTQGGVHHAQLSPWGAYLIDSYATPTAARTIDLIATKKGTTRRLFEAQNPYDGLEMPTIRVGTIKAADEATDLWYRMVTPADFEATRRYPVVVYVYGGPHAQMITDGWLHGARGWDLYMATRGYIVFTLDNRGSSNRGLAFENVTFRRLGLEECKDQVRGVEYLKSLPYVDAARIGVHGWSYGGHMTTALMLRYPDLFQVGVAGGPVIDWKYYEVMYGERYMDTPQTNASGYDACNLNRLAGRLKGHLLLIHDDHDDTCVPQHTLSFLKACVDARTYPDVFIYPTHKHNVLGRDRVHLHEKITRYFDQYLQP
ncbi:MAG: S9 family peptidase [Prevotellaceae bacterium]|jgi:dipeptidyl-peptidase-4|nr:S9 family peptidase [Prevotellaceae bacterium]